MMIWCPRPSSDLYGKVSTVAFQSIWQSYVGMSLSWSVLGHVLSEEQSKDGFDGVSDDGRLTIVQCHCHHRPPSSNLYQALSEYFLQSDTTNKPAFLSLPLPTSTMCYLLQHNQSPTTLHTRSMFQANHIVHAPVLEVMGLGHHKDLWGFELASIGTLRSTSLFIICSFYYHMLSKLTPYMFMFLLCINTPVCYMYFASSNINLATYFS